MGKFNKKKNNAPKSRKEQRKAQRKEKKQRKFESYVNHNKPGKFVLNPNQQNDDNNKDEKYIKKSKPNKNNLDVTDLQTKQVKAEHAAHKKLQKDMDRQRKKQLKVANMDEDRNIKQLEKQLKLNKRKNKNISKAFSSDGLDYLLEVCEPENMKSIAAAEQQFADLNNEFDDDYALVTGKYSKDEEKNESDGSMDDLIPNSKKKTKIDDSLDELEHGYESDYSENSDDINSDFGSNDSDSGDDSIDVEPIEKTNGKRKKQFDDESNISKKKLKSNKKQIDSEESEDFSDGNDDGSEDFNSNKDNNEEQNELWEDIYGRTRNKKGEVVTEKIENKYVPPALRGIKDNKNVDQKQAEKLLRLKKILKGLLNRLAESNMHSISSQIEDMYMSNSRNDMNATLTQLIFEALIAPVTTPERLLLEYMMLVTILHANIGTEVGAQFLQNVVKKFDELYNENHPVENKSLDNAVHIIAQLYNFKVFHSQLLYQILAKLTDKFEEKHVECILLILKNVGFSLRKDDPLALKQLILDLQKKATLITDNNARVKYMLDILLAIKNNNVSKIPNYDTTYSEHLKKLLKTFVRKGNYVTQLNISLEDLLKADERGRWWIVGSAWTGIDDKKQEKTDTNSTPLSQSYNSKLLELAKKQRMNTDTRRSIFCALMTAENYTDAFEKILGIGLKGQQEREIIHVLLHCSLQEKDYNPYYTLLAQKFCEYDRKYQMMIRCSIWDKLKTLTECSGKQISILARLLIYLFINQGLPISTLKVIQFSELDQVTLRLMRQVLLGILLHENEELCLGVFEKISSTPKLKMFRESLRLFIHHFLLKNLNNTELTEDNRNLLLLRSKLVERSLSKSDNKSAF